MVLFEAGPRKSELLSSLVKDVEFDTYGCELKFSERNDEDALKTGERTVTLTHSTMYLRAWLNVHPCRLDNGLANPDAPLWVSLKAVKVKDKDGKDTDSVCYPKLQGQGLYEQLQKIGERAGINKRVNPHSWRHTAATHAAEYFSDAQMRVYFGWEPTSLMPGKYTHDPNTKNAKLKADGIEIYEDKNTGLKSIRCSKCAEFNDIEKAYCGRCGNPLKREAETSESELFKSLMRVLAESGKIEELTKLIQKQAVKTA